jgi:hypothetical protein
VNELQTLVAGDAGTPVPHTTRMIERAPVARKPGTPKPAAKRGMEHHPVQPRPEFAAATVNASERAFPLDDREFSDF